ncbi:DNA (cytosine-5-)-methyltransferase [Rhizobium sp. S163]|uniref:DNA cytosine methyltransferase n=1 Tax=Rhizobium sp. S163 TaxID=3055039 RepID=UPI0025AA2399|nr:DNA (cytosine-5-)-methyltransferase [Rhizobium sp. S163]MDM9644833.1 DNA (cytosine-5-)-methyltransferase [Rhizobium sp. S163]
MAAEVAKLTDIVPAAEAKAFLKARCNLPATELSTYLGFATTLKGSEGVLQKSRASFPVVKALVFADAETRRDILERMEIGARIDTKDVATIRRKLAAAKLTVAEQEAIIRRKAAAATARRHARDTMAAFQAGLEAFIGKVSVLSHEDRIVPSSLMNEAAGLLSEFESLFGDKHPSITGLRERDPGYWAARAHLALKRFRDGRFEGDRGYSLGLRDNDLGPTAIDALAAMTGKPTKAWGVVRMPSVMAVLPPERFRPRVLELCAGAGGLALGLELAGFKHVGLVEFDRNAAATLRKNRPEWNVIEHDVRKVDFTQYRNQRVDLLAGGLPCTPFTTVGKRKGKADENDLMMEGVRAVREVAPKAFVFENVEGLLHSKHSDYLAFLLRKFSKAGYVTDIHRINTRDYGVAQDRSRIMIVGFRKDLADVFRMPPKFPGMATNMGDVLHDLMSENGWNGADDWARTMRERPEFDRFGNPIGVGALSDTIRGYQGSPKEGEARRALMNGVSYAPLAKAAPTNAEAAREGFVPGLTTRMRARLQGFPDEWAFVGGLGSVADQIGNAVAPAVGQAMGLALMSALTGWEFDWEAMFHSGAGSRRSLVSPPPLDDRDFLTIRGKVPLI